jgi:hypothetical protein
MCSGTQRREWEVDGEEEDGHERPVLLVFMIASLGNGL